MRFVAIGILLCIGCREDVADVDGAYYAWDNRAVHCAIDIDASSGIDIASIGHGLDRARDRGEVLELLVHQPGVTLPWDQFEAVLAAASDRGLPFLTYRDLQAGAPVGGIALEYDDWWVQPWTDSRPLLAQYGAKVTIFVAHYAGMADTGKAMIRTLADDGNDIEAHSVHHLRGSEYVEAHGLDAYMSNEIVPSIDVLQADGYDISAYAYPFGARTGEMDRAILAHVPVLRSLVGTEPLHDEGCPY